MKPVPGFDHPLNEKMFLNVQPGPLLVQLWTISMCPITGHQGEEIKPLSPLPFQEAVESNEVTAQPPFPQTRQVKILIHSLWDVLSSPFRTFVTLLWTHWITLTSFLNFRAQNCRVYSRWGLTEGQLLLLTSYLHLSCNFSSILGISLTTSIWRKTWCSASNRR